jgi:hypothetical protein
MKRSLGAIFVVASAVLGFVCGNQAPAIINELPHPISVAVRYADGSTRGGELPPGGVLFFGGQTAAPVEVTASSGGTTLLQRTQADAPELLGSAPSGAFIGWRLSSGGAELITREALANH